MAVEIDRLTSTIDVSGEGSLPPQAELLRLARAVARILAEEVRSDANRREATDVRNRAAPETAARGKS